MEVTVKFQGIIADMLGRKTAQIALPDGATVDDLLATLTGTDKTAQTVLKQTRAFIDGKQAERAAPLENGTEVIFMRPIAGGAGPHPQPLSPPSPPPLEGGVSQCAGRGVC